MIGMRDCAFFMHYAMNRLIYYFKDKLKGSDYN